MKKDDSGIILGVYTYGNDLVKMRRDSTDSYYLYDGLGSVRQVTNSSKDVTDSYIYEAFGALVASTGSTENTRKFTGEDYDATSSLLYLRARYYDPDVGRFISRDPIGVIGGINLYGYCGNNPVNWVDPDGKIIGQVISGGLIAYAGIRAACATLAAADAVDKCRKQGDDETASDDAGEKEGKEPQDKKAEEPAWRKKLRKFCKKRGWYNSGKDSFPINPAGPGSLPDPS